MATQGRFGEVLGTAIGAEANETFAAKQHRAASLNSSGLAIVPTAQGAWGPGIMQDNPVANVMGSIMTEGISWGVLAGTVAVGDALTCDTAGDLIKAHGGEHVYGRALASGVDNDKIPVLLGGDSVHTVLLPLGTILLASLDNANLVSVLPLDFKGEVIRMYAIVMVATQDTSGKQAVLTVRLTPAGGSITTVTSCVLTIDTDVTAADPDTIGKFVQGVAATGAATFNKGDTLSVVASNITPFTSGEASFFVVIEQ